VWMVLGWSHWVLVRHGVLQYTIEYGETALGIGVPMLRQVRTRRSPNRARYGACVAPCAGPTSRSAVGGKGEGGQMTPSTVEGR
jgi:hypothetical protein